MQVDVMIARFPYKNQEHPDVTDWLVETVLKMKSDPRIGRILPWRENDTPITMLRNKALRTAKERWKVDLVLMIDSDMAPDDLRYLVKPFWDSSFDFWFRQRRPCLIAAPYCGPPPHENVYVFKWGSRESEQPGDRFHVDQFTREEAVSRAGFEDVAALPTGLMLIDVRVLEGLAPPWFYYEYTDEYEEVKSSTEDVTFTRDVSLMGHPVFCNWDAWAGHWKDKKVGKPQLLTVDQIKEKYVRAVRRNMRSDERLTIVNPGEALAPPPRPEPAAK